MVYFTLQSRILKKDLPFNSLTPHYVLCNFRMYFTTVKRSYVSSFEHLSRFINSDRLSPSCNNFTKSACATEITSFDPVVLLSINQCLSGKTSLALKCNVRLSVTYRLHIFVNRKNNCNTQQHVQGWKQIKEVVILS